jgi:hypothetical protein
MMIERPHSRLSGMEAPPDSDEPAGRGREGWATEDDELLLLDELEETDEAPDDEESEELF